MISRLSDSAATCSRGWLLSSFGACRRLSPPKRGRISAQRGRGATRWKGSIRAVFQSLAEKYRQILVWWTEQIIRLAPVVVLSSALLTAAAVTYLAQNIRIDTSTSDMLSPELPFRQYDREMDAAFPQFSDSILVVVEGSTPDQADRAALRLAELMRRDPRTYGEIYDLAGDDFFRKHGLLYLETEELYDLSDRLAEAQPFLAALWRDPSSRGLFKMLGRAVEYRDDETAGPPIAIASVLDAVTDVAEALNEGVYRELSWRRMMGNEDDGANANRRFILVQPKLEFDTLSPADDVMDAIRALAAGQNMTADNGLRVRLTGSAALEQEELESVERGMGIAGLVSLTLVTVLLVVGLKSVKLVLSTVATLLMGLVWTAAFAILALDRLNLISVAFAVLFIGLSVDFGIHYGLRYLEGLANGTRQSLVNASRDVGGALTLTAVSAAIAFYSFLPTDYLGLAELGVIAGTGMFIALFANLSVLPALLTLAPVKLSLQRPLELSASGVNAAIRHRYRPVIGVFAILTLAAAVLAPRVAFDFDPLNLKNRETESMSTLVDLMADRRTSPYSIDILADDLDAARTLATRLEKLDVVDHAETVADYVPSDQDEKIEVISTMALFLGPALATTDTDPTPTAIERSEALQEFLADLETLRSKARDGRERDATERLLRALRGLAGGGAGNLEKLERRLTSALRPQLAILKRSLEAQPVALEDLPEGLLQRQIAFDGRTRIEVFPKEDVRDRERLEEFVERVRAVAPKAIGSPVIILEAGATVLRSFFQAGGIAFAVIAIMLIIVLGRFGDVVLVFAPLIVAGLLSPGAVVLSGLAFNFANVIVLPLLFGLGVAGSIHLVIRERRCGGEGRGFATSTPRAVVFSALTTIGSFGSIALSSHPGTSSMGVLLTIVIALTLPCTLVFLPALMTMIGIGKETTE